MATCPRCGGEVVAEDGLCEHCGHRLSGVSPVTTEAAPPGRKLIAGIGCGMLTVMLILISIFVVFGALLGGLLGAAGARPS